MGLVFVVEVGLYDIYLELRCYFFLWLDDYLGFRV